MGTDRIVDEKWVDIDEKQGCLENSSVVKLFDESHLIDGIYVRINKKTLVGYYSKNTNKSYNIPSGITLIQEYSFTECNFLEEVTIPSTVKTISKYAFSKCTNLKKVIFEENSSLENIYWGAFKDCRSLEEICLPQYTHHIEAFTFKGCTSLKKIELPFEMSHLGPSVFEQCSSLIDIKLPTELLKIENHLFDGCSSLETIDIPKRTRCIDNGAFQNCTSLHTINFSSDIEQLEGPLFKNTPCLKKITLPQNLLYIGEDCFRECSLEDIKIPSLVMEIKSNTFANATNLRKVFLGFDVSSVACTAFDGCENLEKINVSKNNPVFYSKEGVLFTGGTLVKYPANKKNKIYKVDSRIFELDVNSFSGNNHIEEVVLSEKTEILNTSSFKDCKNLKKIVESEGIVKYMDSCFLGCSNLTEINIGKDCNYIGSYCFSETSLRKIKIPETVSYLQPYSFRHCNKLQNVDLLGVNTVVTDKSFSDCENFSLCAYFSKDESSLPEELNKSISISYREPFCWDDEVDVL